MSTIVRLQDVSKSYTQRRVEALDRVSLEFSRGDFIALLGPSGCGKSTLLNLIGCVDRATGGTIEIAGLSVSSLSERELTDWRRQSVGFVFQFFNLLPTLTVEENVSLPLILNGVHRRLVKERTAAILERVGLTDRRSFLPATLSGGEMQRTAVARAVVHEPRLLLADEPTGNLDSVNGKIVLDLLESLNRDIELTIVMATHSPEAAARAGKVVELYDGRIAGPQ
ncbi:MAG: ABC transporter ATP-binding protein [Cyanobacteria bacterium HKST-UBA02]|nr:ABC transporter ATP-binding protein [Cyanobacteria bacterium HKST-UBA02]